MLMVNCPDCGERMPAEKLIRHRPKGICLAKLNRSIKGSPHAQVITAAELMDRQDGNVSHGIHGAHRKGGGCYEHMEDSNG